MFRNSFLLYYKRKITGNLFTTIKKKKQKKKTFNRLRIQNFFSIQYLIEYNACNYSTFCVMIVLWIVIRTKARPEANIIQ